MSGGLGLKPCLSLGIEGLSLVYFWGLRFESCLMAALACSSSRSIIATKAPKIGFIMRNSHEGRIGNAQLM